MAKNEYLPANLREALRQSAIKLSAELSRSVARVSSLDPEPCPEDGELIAEQRRIMARLDTVQRCRAALERCMETGRAGVRYDAGSGTPMYVRFKLLPRNRIDASLLPGREPAKKA